MKKIQEQLKNLKNEDVFQARPSWVLENKQLLMSQISKTRVEASERQEKKTLSESWRNFSHIYQMFVPTNMNKAFRPILTAIMALIITSGGWIASAYAEPGDFMWSTKVAFNSVVEQGKLALTPEEKKTSVQLEFASKRAQIIRQVADSNTDKDTKNKLIKENSEDLKNKLDGVSESLQKTDAQSASNLVKEVSLKTKEISHTLKDVAEKTAFEDEELSKDLSLQATDTSKKSLELVEVVLEKKAEAKSEVSEEEKIIIKEHIADSVNEIKADSEKVKEQANKLVENNDNLEPVDLESLETTSSSTPEENVSSTVSKLSEEATSSLKTNITDIKTKAEEFSKNIETENDNVQTLLDSDVLEAVKKTIELKNTVSSLSQEVDTTLVKINNVDTTNNVVEENVEDVIDVENTTTTEKLTTTTKKEIQ